MKHLFTVLFLFTILLQSATLTIQDVDINKTNGYIVYKKGTQNEVTGILQYFYDDNQTLKQTVPLKDGKINGVNKIFYISGKLKAMVDYRDSQREGKQTVYYESGQKSYEAEMHKEKREGVVKEWYSNGQLRYNLTYKNGKVTGLAKVYDKNGSVESIEEYKDGKLVKQIQPKKPDNRKLQTRALTTYGEGDEIYYLFISPSCGHCKKFLDTIEQYKKEVTFYIYYIPSNPKNRDERKILDIVYSKSGMGEKIKSIFKAKEGTLDLSEKIKDKDLYINNTEILKAQQMQMFMGVHSIPTLIDTKGFIYNAQEFHRKFKK